MCVCKPCVREGNKRWFRIFRIERAAQTSETGPESVHHGQEFSGGLGRWNSLLLFLCCVLVEVERREAMTQIKGFTYKRRGLERQ